LKFEISDLRSRADAFKSQISTFKLLAVDTDVDSITIAKENAAMNGVSDAIAFSIGSISDDTPPADFVCANLTLDVIEPLLPTLLVKAKKTLVLSGILFDQQQQIVNALEAQGRNGFDISRAGEWICVVLSCRNRER